MADPLPPPARGGVASAFSPPPMSARDAGFLVGLLVGEGHFGGDGRQPQVTLRMHVRHEDLFDWLVAHVPGSRLYGPYAHGGRTYLQWMSRGRNLAEVLVPLILEYAELVDNYTWQRFQAMCERYGLTVPARSAE